MKRKSNKKIYVAGPSITSKEIEYVAQAAKSAWYDDAYKYVYKFENKFADYIGTKYALATSSCTGALHLALLSAGLKKGDEVIVPDITWIASVAPLVYMGIKPVFIDIEIDTWCINTSQIENAITSRTKAIIPVHLYGNPCDMDQIMAIAKKYDLLVIEDAAESVGALYKGRKTGSIGNIGVFSFHGTKTLTTGEGGMLVTDDEGVYKRALFLNNHAKDTEKLFWNSEVGYKYKMSDMQAALGLAQLERIDELVSYKRKIFEWYKKRLENINGITLNMEREYCKNTYWMVSLLIDKSFGMSKEDIMNKLVTYNIDPRPFFYPLTSMPPFKQEVSHPVSYSISQSAINLPCSLRITESEVNYVCNAIREILFTSKQ